MQIAGADDGTGVVYTTNRLGPSFQYTFSQVPPLGCAMACKPACLVPL